jgi:proline dehydrogenase
VPFGPVGEVAPYLIRRMQENRGLIARTVKERQLLRKEIKRRLSPFK